VKRTSATLEFAYRENLANRSYVMHFVIGSTCEHALDAISEIVFIPIVIGKYAHLPLSFLKKIDDDRIESSPIELVCNYSSSSFGEAFKIRRHRHVDKYVHVVPYKADNRCSHCPRAFRIFPTRPLSRPLSLFHHECSETRARSMIMSLKYHSLRDKYVTTVVKI